MQRINETKSWFFEKINKTDRHLGNSTKMRRDKTQISKIRYTKMQKCKHHRNPGNHQRLL
jgi:hypothetical protein